MERVTEWRGEHAAIVNNHVNYIDLLAEYEDTGFTPQEIKSLHGEWNANRNALDYARAERDAVTKRLIELAKDDMMHLRIKAGKLIQSCEDKGTEYLETPDGLRLIFRDHKYAGWYLPGEGDDGIAHLL